MLNNVEFEIGAACKMFGMCSIQVQKCKCTQWKLCNPIRLYFESKKMSEDNVENEIIKF